MLLSSRRSPHTLLCAFFFGFLPFDAQVAYGILLDCLCKARASEEAEGYFEQMGRDRIQLNEKILTVMMRIRSDQGDVNGVKELFGLLEKPRLFRYARFSLNEDIPCFVTRWLWKHSFFPPLQQNLIRFFFPENFRYNVLIHALGMNGNIPEATELLETMKANGVTPDVVTFNTMMKVRTLTTQARDRTSTRGFRYRG